MLCLPIDAQSIPGLIGNNKRIKKYEGKRVLRIESAMEERRAQAETKQKMSKRMQTQEV